MSTIGVYLTCDDAECLDCFALGGGIEAWRADGGFEGWEAPLDIDNGDESDTPTHCVTCGRLIEHELTPEGYAYVAEKLLEGFHEGKRSPVVQMWLNAYAEDFDGEELAGTEAGAVDSRDAAGLYALLPMDDHPTFDKYRQFLKENA